MEWDPEKLSCAQIGDAGTSFVSISQLEVALLDQKNNTDTTRVGVKQQIKLAGSVAPGFSNLSESYSVMGSYPI